MVKNKIDEKVSGIRNPSTLQMMLYFTIVLPKELFSGNDWLELNNRYDKVNKIFNNLCIEKLSTYDKDKKNGIDYIKHIRNSISHSKVEYSVENRITFVSFIDEHKYKNTINKCKIKIKTCDIGQIMDELILMLKEYCNNKSNTYNTKL